MKAYNRAVLLSCAMGASLAFSQNALAGDAPSNATIETVIVTAQKRTETLQKTPAAVTVLNADQLQVRGVLALPALTDIIPSTRINLQREFAVIYVRGLGQQINGLEADPAVEVDADGMYIPREALESSLFDLQDIQFLPGPQGTLYGRNAIAGAININTKRPGDSFGTNASLEVGDYALIHATAGVTVPFSDDFSVRLAANYVKHNGYVTNGTHDKNEFAVRLSAIYKPTENLSIFVTGTHSHTGGVGFNPTVVPLDSSWLSDPHYSNPWYSSPATVSAKDLGNSNSGTLNLVSAEIKYRFGNGMALTYIPGYLDFTNDGWNLFFFDYPPYKQSAAIPDLYEPWSQYSQELRLSQDKDNLHWVIGLYQYHSKGQKFQDVYKWHSVADALASAPVRNPGWPIGPTGTTKAGPPDKHKKADETLEDSYAIFADATYSLAKDFRIELGGRYSYDRKHGFTLPSGMDSFNRRNTWYNMSWKAGLQYDVAPESMLYATVETAYLEGGYNTDAGSAIVPIPATIKPETMLAFTAGSKNRFLDDRLQVNDEAYYYIVHGLQVAMKMNINPTGSTTAATAIFNAKRATIYGDDLDVIYLLTPEDRFDMHLSLLHAVVNHYGLPPNTYVDSLSGPVLAANPDFPGYALPYAPSVSLSVGYAHTFTFEDNSALVAQVDTHYDSGEYQSALDRGLPGIYQSAWHKTDVSLTYYPAEGHWSVGLWAKNLENRATYNGMALHGPVPSTTILDPRTYGGRLTYSY